MEDYIKNVKYEEESKNINEVKISGWYPSNLVSPVKVNGNIFNREKRIKQKDEDYADFINSKIDKITKINAQSKIIETNPMNLLSSEQDEFTYINRLVPLYRNHLMYK